MVFALFYLPEAEWVRDVRPFSQETVVYFETKQDAYDYIINVLDPYCGGISAILQKIDIVEVEEDEM